MDNHEPRLEMGVSDAPLYERHDFAPDDQRRIEQLIETVGDANDDLLAALSQLPDKDTKRKAVTALRDAYREGIKVLEEWIAALE